MSEGRPTPARMASEANDDRVDALATRALSVVARQSGRAPRALAQAYIELLHDAALSAEAGAFDQVTSRMVAAGIRIDEIADCYIPAVARRMGEMWCDDLMGFAAVTIGVSRLQMLLRDLGPEWHADRAANADAPALLLMVGSDVYHTLGATVLAGQLRRRGLSVRLMIGAKAADVGPLLRELRFDAVLISCSHGESLESIRRLVDAVKTANAAPPPVVIGGSINDDCGASGIDLRTQTGADHVTSDLNEALKLCGMTTTPHSPARRGRRS